MKLGIKNKQSIKASINTIIFNICIMLVIINFIDWIKWSIYTNDNQLDKELMWDAIGGISTALAVISGIFILYKTLSVQIRENRFNLEMQEHNEIVKEFKELLKFLEPGIIFKSLKYLQIDNNQCYYSLVDYINESTKSGFRVSLTIPQMEYNETIVKDNNWTKSLRELIEFQKEKVEEIRIKVNELNYNQEYVAKSIDMKECETLNEQILNLHESEEKNKLLEKNNHNIEKIANIIENTKKYCDVSKIMSEIEILKDDIGKGLDSRYNKFYSDVKLYLENRRKSILEKYDKI